MPRISEFFGIVIAMYFGDHDPPHFHALYRGEEAAVGIDPIQVLAGYLPPRTRALVLEWAELNQESLKANWDRAIAHQPLEKIDPLE